MTNGKDADRRIAIPEDSRTGRDGTSLDTGRERQASAAAEETSRPETMMLFEEVLRRDPANARARSYLILLHGGFPAGPPVGAATPPPATTVLSPVSSTARNRLRRSISIAVLWKEAAISSAATPVPVSAALGFCEVFFCRNCSN